MTTLKNDLGLVLGFTYEQAQSVEHIIQQEAIDLADELVRRFGVTIGGSYLVHGRYAQDLDVFCTNTEFFDFIEPYLFQERIDFGVNDVAAKKYSDDAGYALHGVYNAGQVQIIVVKDEYVPAYKQAARIMATDPKTFQDKPDRVALHRILRYLVRNGD